VKLYKPKPLTLHGRVCERAAQIFASHPETKLMVGDVAPMDDVIAGRVCCVMISRGPLLIAKYPDRSRTQFLFDAYSQ
jgi:hypothetical protein